MLLTGAMCDAKHVGAGGLNLMRRCPLCTVPAITKGERGGPDLCPGSGSTQVKALEERLCRVGKMQLIQALISTRITRKKSASRVTTNVNHTAEAASAAKCCIICSQEQIRKAFHQQTDLPGLKEAQKQTRRGRAG